MFFLDVWWLGGGVGGGELNTATSCFLFCSLPYKGRMGGKLKQKE